MKISVIVPIYNVEEDIVRCLQSVVQQDYPHIELIIVNDKTPDKSFLIAKDYIVSVGFLKQTILIEHDCNLGVSDARNSGIEVASGEYVFFLDNDDALSNHQVISNLVKIAEKYKLPDLVIGSYQYIVDGKIAKTHQLPDKYYSSHESLYHDYCGKGIYWAAWGRLVKRTLIEEYDLSFKSRLYSEDILWSFFLFKNAKTACLSSLIIYDYYNRPGSIMSSLSEKHLLDLKIILEDMYLSYQLERSERSLKDTATLIERYRRLYLQYIFCLNQSSNEHKKINIKFLQSIKLPTNVKGGFKYLRQNVLLRMPTIFVFKYLNFKWKNIRHKH